jgi:hypothetical protein
VRAVEAVAMETSPTARRTPRVRRDEAGGKRPDGHVQSKVRHRPDPARIHVTPTTDRLTGVAGLVAFGVFLRAIGLDAARHAAFDDLKEGPRMVYRVGEVLRLLRDALVAGETRVFGLEALAADALLTRLAGGMVPSVDIVYDDLRRFRALDRNAPRDLMVEHGLALRRGRAFTILHLDIDTTVEPLFGAEIEGARPGPNPRYHGRPSDHPLLARIAEVNAIVGARLRPGDRSFGEADVPWLREVLQTVRKAVGPTVLLVVRIDAAGDCLAVLKAVDALGVRVLVKAKMTPDRCAGIVALPATQWRTTDRDVDGRPSQQMATLDFTRSCWDAACVRFDVVAVRERDKDGGRKLYRWPDTDWTAHAYVSNAFDWDEEESVATYAPRAGIEPLIGELKRSYGLGQVPTGDFDANHVMFLLKLLAYNLVQRFVRARHPALTGWHLPWLRRVLFCVPGRLVRHARGTELQVPETSRIARMLN